MKTAIIALSMLCMVCISAQAKPGSNSNSNSDQELSITDVLDFLKNCECYFIATVDGDQPRVRPFGTAVIFEGKLYIQTSKQKNVSKQIQENPKVEICALNKEANRWIRIEATLVNDDRIEAKKYMLDAYPALKAMYSAEDENTQVLHLKDATATFYSFTDETKVVKF